MKNWILVVLYLSFPVGLLIMGAITFQGRQATRWFVEMKMAQRSPGLDGLQKMGNAAVPTLQKALKSSERYQRFRAAWTLGQLGTAASNAIPDLIQAVDDKDISVQMYSMQSLATIGTPREDLVPKLLAKLNKPTLTSYAAELLEKIERERKAKNLRSIPGNEFDYAMAFTRSPVPNVRLMGARRLANLPSEDERVMTPLKSLLNDTNGWVREQTAKFLKDQRIKGPNRLNSTDTTNSVQVSPQK